METPIVWVKSHSLIKDYEVIGVLQEYKYEAIGRLVYE